MDRVADEGFARETQELMLQRARVALLLGASILIGFVAVDLLRFAPERYGTVIGLRVAGGILLLCMLPATRGRHALGRSRWVGAAAIVIVLATTAAIMPLLGGPADPQYAVQSTGLALCLLGASLLLPFEPREMLILGVLGTGFHIGFTVGFPPAQSLPSVVATLSAAAIAVVGARELTRSRHADFEGRRAKETLMRAREDLVAMLTHDIKNPLGIIDGLIEMLQDEENLTPEERAGLLVDAQRAVRNAIALAANFLDASKIEAGRFVLKTRTADIGDVVRGTLDDHRPHAVQKGVTLVHDSAPDLPPIEADVPALARVFANLLGNAIKHTPAGGTIRVAANSVSTDRIEIVVEDSGDGIPPGLETRIFERYTGAASREDSTGLGLYIARTITAAHGGTISVENRRDTHGACFRVVLPAAARTAS